MNKRILIDFRHIDKKNGFSAYLIMILKAIVSVDREFFLLINKTNFNFDEYIQTNKNIKFIKIKSKPFSIIQNLEIPLILKKYKINLFHSINFDVPIFMFLCKECKIVTTIHDLIPLLNKDIHKRSFIKNLYFKIMFKLCSVISSKILTVSEYSKHDIIKYLKVKPEKIVTIHCSFRGKNIPQRVDYILHVPPKIFFIGNNFEHKNILTGIKAVEILKKKNVDVVFNIAGQKTKYTEKLEKYIKEHNLEKNAQILGKISDEKVDELFSTSDIFIFPSLAEGFGSPILEAMNYGLPIISSNKTCLPEVVGDAGILIDPTPENFAEKIEYLINNSSRLKELVGIGYKRIKKFSQDNFNKKIIEVYARIC